MKELEVITRLSHLFGGEEWVKGGGGNTSCKVDGRLYVKPSGTTLKGLSPWSFVVMDRQELSKLDSLVPDPDSSRREAQVKAAMEKATLPDVPGRASVEAPLHNSFQATYVVHTHPTFVNGMTCSLQGAEVCSKLFPDSLWVEYIDPGFTLCRVVGERLKDYREKHGREPELLFLENHGVFVATSSPERMEELHNQMRETLTKAYETSVIDLTIKETAPGNGLSADAGNLISALEELGQTSNWIILHGKMDGPEGPFSPDHIVYMKSFPFRGTPSKEGLEAYQNQYGCLPRIIITDHGTIACGKTQREANLAMDLFRDACEILALSKAFGGPQLLGDEFRAFIENWEVESYRAKQMS